MCSNSPVAQITSVVLTEFISERVYWSQHEKPQKPHNRTKPQESEIPNPTEKLFIAETPTVPNLTFYVNISDAKTAANSL